MLARYVVADLLRNPRRTLSTMVGVTLGVGLFCAVLFFVDGLSASMTQRAVAPLPIDMQRIVTERVGGALTLDQTFDTPGTVSPGARGKVLLEVRNTSDVAANEVVVRSIPDGALRFLPGSATLDRTPVTSVDDNPFAHGPGVIGLNIGTVPPGGVRHLSYGVEALAGTGLSNATVSATYSSRESVRPVAANERSAVPLDELAHQVSILDGVADASQLSFADLGVRTLSSGDTVVGGAAKIFGFDADYAARDRTVKVLEGKLTASGAVLSAEAAQTMGASIGDRVTVTLPDTSKLDLTVSGIADLSRARSLFSSRRGGDLETFVYTSSSVIVTPKIFAGTVLPAYERAATTRGARLKTPPVREVDITLDRDLLDADPATALVQTQRINANISSVAAHQDYLLDNISNTLGVASADAMVAKRLFVFLGVPGGLLAAFLASYAGSVLAQGQRREQATLRVRGASRRHLMRMLTLRTALLTGVGAVLGLGIGYLAALVVLGQESLARASTTSLSTSAIVGTLGGFLATGAALYLTGRRSIGSEINEDRARLASGAPLWRRLRLDLVGAAVVVVGTVVALRAHAFDGASGSVYFGRAVSLNLALLVLPVAVWISGSLLAARIFGSVLARSQPQSTSGLGRPLPSLFRLSVGRRPWAIANATVVISLIVAVAISLAAFTASYDAAKVTDARFATGSDLRITPGPASARTYARADEDVFRTSGVADTTPVIYAVSNVILRSARTSDPANVAAIDPTTYPEVAPVTDLEFTSDDATGELARLQQDPTAVLLSEDMATFLKAKVGDPIYALLVRATDAQVEVKLHVTGTYIRLPGFPEGADALMSIDKHSTAVASKAPDFFLASTTSPDDATLKRAFTSLREGPGALDHLQIDTRRTTLAKDQSSLAALNISGLVLIDQTFALTMAAVAIGIFVFGLLLQRRREYITLRAQGLAPRTIRLLIAAEAGTVALGGAASGLLVGGAMGYYFINVLRPLFVLPPRYRLTPIDALTPIALVLIATVLAAIAGSRLVNRLEPTELLRDE
ncbi:MAG: ABC transporter permease [Nocardioidaceae bacterium]